MRTRVRSRGRSPVLGRTRPLGCPGRAQTDEELRQKELELERREQALEYRERKLEEVKEIYTKGKPPANWPRFRPLIYHDIQADIPEVSRNICKRVYFSWIRTWAAPGAPRPAHARLTRAAPPRR